MNGQWGDVPTPQSPHGRATFWPEGNHIQRQLRFGTQAKEMKRR